MNGGLSGFGNAPVTKSFLVVSGILSVLSGIQGRAHHLGLSNKGLGIKRMSTLERLSNPYKPIVNFSNGRNNCSSFLDYTSKLLRLSAKTDNLDVGKVVHAKLIVCDQVIENGIVYSNFLINSYAKCGEMTSAHKLFDHMPERNEVSWGALMAGYLHVGSNMEVVELLKSMKSKEHTHPNEYILATVVSACANEGRIGEGSQFHGYVVKSGLEFYQYVKNALINMYFSCYDVQGGMRVWNTLPGHDVFSYNLVLNGLCENGFVMESLGVLGRMANECIAFDTATYSTAFGLCATIKDLKLSKSVHCRMLRSCIDCDVFVGSSLIDMYGKCGDFRKAREIFDKLPCSNLVLWTAVTTAYFQNGCFEEALNILPKMQLQDILPNDYTFTVLLNSCAGLSNLSYGDCLHALIHKVGFGGHTIVGNSLMNMYYKSSDIKSANKVFAHLVHRDSISWNIIICGYSQHGLGGLALCMFQGMVAAGKLPNYVTFIGVLCACGHLGLVQEGFDYLNNVMRYYDIQPGVEHYTCAIGLLGKAGLLDEAERLMRSAPVQWDIVAWRTLLNACIVHKKYGFGQRIAEIVLRMYPNDVGTYTLLSNLYAKAKRWDGVFTIRKLLREKSIKKEPGASWIEVKARTHVFISGDHSHPEYMQIFEKVGELLAKIKALGYVPDISIVLHDIEDEQKEEYLTYHSEKLAVAYGLLKTPPEVPIRIIKNLRICDDCHTAVKLIAKVTERSIIVRDANRFHHFQEGSCSCGDYWWNNGFKGRFVSMQLDDIFEKHKIWKSTLSIFAFSSTPELIFGIYLLYYFRVFERQIGSNKYSVFMLFSLSISFFGQVLALGLLKDVSLKLNSGPYGLIFSSFVPFYLDIPISTRIRVFSLQFSNKSFIYLAGLQLFLSSWRRSVIPGICGLLAGSLYRLNVFYIRKAQIPGCFSSFFTRLRWPSIGSLSPASTRNVAGNMPSFISRPAQPNYPHSMLSAVEPLESSVMTLVSMGFDHDSARQALLHARNDVNQATNILLEAQAHQ